MTTAELDDPNIATLRDYVRRGSVNGTTEKQDADALDAVHALASTLADKTGEAELYRTLLLKQKERIHELEQAAPPDPATHQLAALRALEAPPTPAPEELVAGIEFCKRPGSGVPTNVIEAAESWQRLQWRPASEAPMNTRLVFYVRGRGACLGERRTENWVEDWAEGLWRGAWEETAVLGFIPLDALPALNGGDRWALTDEQRRANLDANLDDWCDRGGDDNG